MQSWDRVVTLSDVAQAAGVSKATASKALSDRYDVSRATKERVLQVAASLGFTPNAVARGLLHGRTESVGIITDDLNGRFAPQIMLGAEDALGADRSCVILANSRNDADVEAHHIEELLKRRVDGLLMVGDIYRAREPVGRRLPIPIIYVYAPSSDPSDISIVSDNRESARMATEHLINAGCRQIVHLGGHHADLAAQDRAAGVDQAIAAAHLTKVADGTRFGEWTEEWGWDGIARLLADGARFDAVVCGDDLIAHGARQQLERHGLAVPDQVAVVGFDNWAVVNANARLPFSSVDMNLPELGRLAAQAVVQRNLDPGIHTVVGTLARPELTIPALSQ